MKIIQTAQDVFVHVQDMYDLHHEYARGLYLNSEHELIHDELFLSGSKESISLHPRTFFKPAIEANAAAVILVHNHPSGNLSPSKADIRLTKRLIKIGKMIGIPLIDHVIITKDAYRSIPSVY